MKKAFVNSIVITNNDTRTLENVIELVVQNYSAAPISFTHKNVTRIIPAVVEVDGVPIPSAPFTINAHGHTFDVEIDIAFESKEIGGKVILDYTTIKNC